MKKQLLIVVLVIVVFSLLTGCEAKEDEPKVYRVNKSTGLYERTDADSPMIRTLSVGTRVKSPNISGILTCVTNAEKMKLCKVEVIGSEDEGWVLSQWID